MAFEMPAAFDADIVFWSTFISSNFVVLDDSEGIVLDLSIDCNILGHCRMLGFAILILRIEEVLVENQAENGVLPEK